MVMRLARLAALVLLGLSLGACGTKGSLGFKERRTTTTTGRTTRSTQGDDSLEDDAPPPPPDLQDPIGASAGLHHPGCPATTETPTSAGVFALVGAPGPGDGSVTRC
jgi:hypothetical protein